MGLLVFSLLWTGLVIGIGVGVEGMGVEAAPPTCPQDYRQRVETCIMEAQVAPQAGGGLSLVINNTTIVDLCQRGLLRKTIDCLQEIRSRCAHNVTKVLELDRLYSVHDWQQGAQLLCEDTDFFLANQDCLSKCTASVMTCVLLRTQIFRIGLVSTQPWDHARMRKVTCNFAESIVKCVRSPLQEFCPLALVRRVAGGMFHFLPPFCHTDNYITVTQRPPSAVTEPLDKAHRDNDDDVDSSVKAEDSHNVETDDDDDLENVETDDDDLENVETDDNNSDSVETEDDEDVDTEFGEESESEETDDDEDLEDEDTDDDEDLEDEDTEDDVAEDTEKVEDWAGVLSPEALGP